MRVVKKASIALAIVVAAMPSWADWETCNYEGDVTGVGRVVNRTQASRTWDDWTWRGKQDGTVQYCSSNSKGCSFTWGKSKTTSYAHSIGWSIGGGFGIEVKKGATGTAGITAAFQKTKTWTKSQSENFDMRTDMGPGQWAQPVIVAVRRWKQGHFYGGHFLKMLTHPDGHKTPNPGPKKGCYWYDWEWKNYGNWTGNEHQWGYKMIHVVNSRNQL